jgi:tetratricopeptide (TPR) repeat protein
LLREAVAALDVSLPARQLLGERYFVHRRLGAGGFGIVYEAEDLRDGGRVALKMLRRPEAGWLSRFKREFRALQGLSHQNLVSFEELFGVGGDWFFTMELIEGDDFISFVAGEEARLRSALQQLLDGLAALHAADKVHRDVKPSNVIVTRGGRLVLIDFGLVLDSAFSTDSAMLGTPAYMAPEQAVDASVGASADLYAVGVMLFEALTGRRPVEGSPLQVLVAKQTFDPVRPSALKAGVPADLDELCWRLLSRVPSERPSAAEARSSLVAAVAGGTRPSGVVLASRESAGPPFVGRSAELSQLERALERAREQGASVLVSGQSGIGKSRLVREFTAMVAARDPRAMVLDGRCHEREAIPYKAVDGVIDALSARLCRLPAVEVKALLPTRRSLLGHLFPSLLRVPQLHDEAARIHAPEGTPHELRRRAFAEVRELFTRIALDRRLLLVIDDLQWADDDGLRVLEEILRPPDAPPLLFLGTFRVARGVRDEVGERLRARIPDAGRLELGALGLGDARELTLALLAHAEAPARTVERVALESEGHPLFVEELARQATSGAFVPLEIRLDEVIWHRVLALEAPSRHLLEVLSVAGRARPRETIRGAAELEPFDFQHRVGALGQQHLVRTQGSEWSDAIDTYHDRIRESVCAHLAPARTAEIHNRIARTLASAPERDAEGLAWHYRCAGDTLSAARYAVEAGDQALGTLAFDQAAGWFEEAFTLYPADHAARRELRVKLGEALALAGRGSLAAEHFEIAASQAEPTVALELRRRAAEQLLTSGHFDRGIAASRQVLRMIDLRMPATRLGTLLALLWSGLRLRVHGLTFRSRRALGAHELVRIDTCWSIAKALGFADTMVGFVFSQRALLLALQAGDAERIISPLAMAASYLYSGGAPSRRGRRMLRLALRLSRGPDRARQRVVVGVGLGLARTFQGRYRDALPTLTRALDLATRVRGVAFERGALQSVLVEALALVGRYRRLSELQNEALRDAVTRGDVYATVSMQIGSANLRWLMDDRPDQAQEALEAATRVWSPHGYHREHFYSLMARIAVKLYAGELETARAFAEEVLARTRPSLLWRIQVWRVRIWYQHGATALALVAAGLGDRRALLRSVTRDAAAVEREGRLWMRPFSELLRAGVDLHDGARDRALQRLETSERGFRAQGLLGYACAAGERRARLRDDAESATTLTRAAAWLRAEGVVRPERLLAVLAPGYEHLVPVSASRGDAVAPSSRTDPAARPADLPGMARGPLERPPRSAG